MAAAFSATASDSAASSAGRSQSADSGHHDSAAAAVRYSGSVAAHDDSMHAASVNSVPFSWLTDAATSGHELRRPTATSSACKTSVVQTLNGDGSSGCTCLHLCLHAVGVNFVPCSWLTDVATSGHELRRPTATSTPRAPAPARWSMSSPSEQAVSHRHVHLHVCERVQ
eukprot:SAG31_NODE_13135_length_890_cov_5.208597_1_plen_168_part_10